MAYKMTKYRKIILAFMAIEQLLFLFVWLIFNNELSMWIFLYALIKNISLLVFVFYFYQEKEKENINISRVLGNEAKNALLFGEVGIVLYNETLTITWVSDLFSELGIDLIGKRIDLWRPLIMKTFDSDETIEIEMNGQVYDVYNHLETKSLYVKNINNFKRIVDLYNHEKIVLGIMNIDNYEETINSKDDHTAALIQAKIRQVISDWAKTHGILLRRFRSDNYMMILNEAQYRILVNEKFSILGIVKEAAKQLETVLTLSIGIARNCKDMRELESLSTSSINLALSRGGDQVVVKSEGEPVRFYGGNSEAIEKSNRVRSRVISQSLYGLIESSSNVVIMGHLETDFDSLGASVGILKVVQAAGKTGNIVLDMDSVEEKTMRGVNDLLEDAGYQNIFVTPSKAADLTKNTTLVVMVDHHRPSLSIAKDILTKTKSIVVIDHHRRGEEFVENSILTYLEPVASSTVELVVELIGYRENKIQLTEKEATILYTGLLVDTNDFKSKVGVRTFNSAAALKTRNASVTKAYEYLEEGYDFIVTQAKIMGTAKKINDSILVAYAPDGVEVTRAVLAKIANEVVEVSEMEAAFILGEIEKDNIAISGRSKGKLNIQVIMEELGGGGHFRSAATQMEDKDIFECIEILEEVILKHVKEGE